MSDLSGPPKVIDCKDCAIVILCIHNAVFRGYGINVC